MANGTNDAEVVFFDAAGTLFEVRGSVGEIYSAVARRRGVHVPAAELDCSFDTAFRIQSAEGLAHAGAGPEAEKEWWRRLVRRVFGMRMPPGVFPGFFDEVYELFRTSRAWVLYEDTVPALKLLRSRGCRLGVISNFDSRLEDVLSGLGIGSYFERVIFSWQVRSAKPDGRIFRHALALMGVGPPDALHVGDSLDEDVRGARGAGMRAVLLDRSGRHRRWHGGPRIESLDELGALCAGARGAGRFRWRPPDA